MILQLKTDVKQKIRFRKLLAIVWLLSVIFIGGCVRDHYQYGLGSKVPRNTNDQPNPVVYGGDHPRLDRMERIVRYPVSVFERWFKDPSKPVDDPVVLKQQTLDAAKLYLVKNELQDVYIDVREYDPATQWARLKANPRIAPFWKYTGGAINVLGSTIFPRRIFHVDAYDPFTNTLAINSSDPTSALYEAAMAKDYRSHHYQGTYAVFQRAPIFPVIQNTKVTSDVLTYARVHDLWELEKNLYPTAYANLGAATVMEGFGFVPVSAGLPLYVAPAAIMAGAVTGGTTGLAVAKQQEPYVQVARERNRSNGVSGLFR